MPLMQGRSKKAFQHNVETEMRANPGPSHRAQNLAIAYSMKRKAQHKAHGGMTKPSHFHHLDGKVDHIMHQKEDGFTDLSRGLAHGGMIEEEEKETGYHPFPPEHERHNAAAMHEDDKDLNQHPVYAMQGEPEEAEVDAEMHERSMDYHDLDRLAYGGMAHGDLVGRIMSKRGHHYSEGGRVANGGMDELDHLADGKPNNFDDLALRDDLESHYGDDDNSGDALGNEQEMKDRRDIISKIMRKRMAQHNPRPA